MGKKDIDEGKDVCLFIILGDMFITSHSWLTYYTILFCSETQNTMLVLLRGVALQHPQEFQSAVMSLPDEQRNKMSMAVSQS